MKFNKCVFICISFFVCSAFMQNLLAEPSGRKVHADKKIPQLSEKGSWLPAVKDVTKNIRLLECSYNEAELKQCKEINSSSAWEVRTEQTMANGGKLYIFSFTARQDMKDAGVAVAFDRYGWTSDNYVMIPSSVYNGNRQRIVNRSYATGLDKTDYNRKDLALTSNPIPQLSPEFGASSRLEVNVSNAATPAMTMLERGKKSGTILLTDQGIEWNKQLLDHALIVEETPDRSIASFVISAPGVRERKPEFIGFSKSPDRGIQVKKGDKIVIRVTEITFPCEDVPELLARFMKDRKLHTAGEAPRNLMPMMSKARCKLSLRWQTGSDRRCRSCYRKSLKWSLLWCKRWLKISLC